jgi:hypothetical protein
VTNLSFNRYIATTRICYHTTLKYLENSGPLILSFNLNIRCFLFLSPARAAGSRINGGLHIVIPGALLLFRADYDDSAPSWRDVGPAREFSTGFYASLFAEMGASAVLALDPAAYDPAPFAAAGLVHLHLHPADAAAGTDADAANAAAAGDATGTDAATAAGRPPGLLSLHAMDRFAAVVDAADGGPVAAHLAGDDAGLREQAAGLVCAYLASRRLLGPREAAAWLCLCWPGPPPAPAAAAAAAADHAANNGSDEGGSCDDEGGGAESGELGRRWRLCGRRRRRRRTY